MPSDHPTEVQCLRELYLSVYKSETGDTLRIVSSRKSSAFDPLPVPGAGMRLVKFPANGLYNMEFVEKISRVDGMPADEVVLSAFLGAFAKAQESFGRLGKPDVGMKVLCLSRFIHGSLPVIRHGSNKSNKS